MNPFSQLICSVLFLLSTTVAAVDKSSLELKLASEGKTPEAFVPPKWAIADRAGGDLNADGLEDAALILVRQQNEEKPETILESPRLLVVLLVDSKGVWRLLGSNDKLLVCMQCGGVRESAGVVIKKGVLVVSQSTGSREFGEHTWRFRMDSKTHRLELIGRDIVIGDSALGNGTTESENYLTGMQIFHRYRYDEKRDKETKTGYKKRRINKSKRLFDDVIGE